MAENWTLTRIEQMIMDGIEEGRTLDYKASDALKKTDGKKNEISKDVSAFANAGGGTIIYGVKEYDNPKKRHLPENIDPVNRNDISKEWLEQIINTKIQPRIEGVEIDPVEVSEEDNSVIYVVTIPQSNTAHQAARHKYYKRFNFESIPMEDYEIRDVMNRASHPDVTLEIELIQKNTNNPSLGSYQNLKNELIIRIKNKGTVMAKYVNYYITLNKFILPEHLQESFKTIEKKPTGEEYIEYYGENTVRDVLDSKMIGGLGSSVIEKLGPSRYDPILPKTVSRSERIQLTDGKIRSFMSEQLSWVIYADNAIPKYESIEMKDITFKMRRLL